MIRRKESVLSGKTFGKSPVSSQEFLANLIEERKVGTSGRNLERKRRQLEVESQTSLASPVALLNLAHTAGRHLVRMAEPVGLR